MEFLKEAKATLQKMSPLELDIEVTKGQTKQVMDFKAQVDPQIIIMEALNRWLYALCVKFKLRFHLFLFLFS